MADISLVSRVKTRLWLEQREGNSKFGEYLRIWTTLNVHYEAIKDELNIDGGMHVLAMFLNKELFWMNNKTIIEFGFRIIWRIMEIPEGVIHFDTLLDLHNSS